MVALAVILIVVGIVFIVLDVALKLAGVLLWIGIVLVVLAVIAALFRYIRRGA